MKVSLEASRTATATPVVSGKKGSQNISNNGNMHLLSVPYIMTLIYLYGDHLGSASVVTDPNGSMVSQQNFDPWGNLRAGTTGTISQTDVNYTGQVKDGSGLLYYHARYYDPFVSRFVSPDSVVPGAGNPQSFNRYSYVKNNPLIRTDPTGHEDSIDCSKNPGNYYYCAVQDNNAYIAKLQNENRTDELNAFLAFMNAIQAGTILNYTGFPLMPWDNHTAIGVGTGVLVEAPGISGKVKYNSAASFWQNSGFHKDYIKLYEIPGISDNQRQVAADFAESQVGKPYAWPGGGPDDTDSWYCTKLVLKSLEAAGVKFFQRSLQDYETLVQVKGGEQEPWGIPSLLTTASDDDIPQALQVTWDGSSQYIGGQK